MKMGLDDDDDTNDKRKIVINTIKYNNSNVLMIV
jgi:hypothetical protein